MGANENAFEDEDLYKDEEALRSKSDDNNEAGSDPSLGGKAGSKQADGLPLPSTADKFPTA